MSFDLDRNSWRAFLSGARRQVSYLTGAKGLCDPTGAVKSAPNGPQGFSMGRGQEQPSPGFGNDAARV